MWSKPWVYGPCWSFRAFFSQPSWSQSQNPSSHGYTDGCGHTTYLLCRGWADNEHMWFTFGLGAFGSRGIFRTFVLHCVSKPMWVHLGIILCQVQGFHPLCRIECHCQHECTWSSFYVGFGGSIPYAALSVTANVCALGIIVLCSGDIPHTLSTSGGCFLFGHTMYGWGLFARTCCENYAGGQMGARCSSYCSLWVGNARVLRSHR